MVARVLTLPLRMNYSHLTPLSDYSTPPQLTQNIKGLPTRAQYLGGETPPYMNKPIPTSCEFLSFFPFRPSSLSGFLVGAQRQPLEIWPGFQFYRAQCPQPSAPTYPSYDGRPSKMIRQAPSNSGTAALGHDWDDGRTGVLKADKCR